jgi:hypothetical protein
MTVTVDYTRPEPLVEKDYPVKDAADEPVFGNVLYEVTGRVSAFDPGRYSGPPEDCYEAEGGEAQVETIFRVEKAGKRTEIAVKSFEKDDIAEMQRLLEIKAANTDPRDDY